MANHLPNLNQSNEHEFVQLILEEAVPLMKPNSNVSMYKDQPKNTYISLTGYYLGQVMNQIERIDQTGILMNSYPFIRSWRMRYGRFEYFQYHMEQYFIANAGLFDRIILLVNHVYDLNIEDKDVRYGVVRKRLNSKKKTEILKALQDFQGLIAKGEKNDYTHATRFWEKSLWYIGLREFALETDMYPDDQVYLKEDLKFDINLYKNEKMKLIILNEKKVIEHLFKLYEVVDHEYKTIRDGLPETKV